MKRLPHTNLIPGSIPTAVITCGDPARATEIAGRLDEHVLLAEQREYRTYVGMKNGRSLTVTSHGIGAPGAAIAFEELIAAGRSRSFAWALVAVCSQTCALGNS
jgi:uridine phosphorylase